MPLTNPRGIVSLGNMKNETAANKANPKGSSVSTKPSIDTIQRNLHEANQGGIYEAIMHWEKELEQYHKRKLATKPRDEMTNGEVWEEMGILTLREKQREEIKALNKQSEKHLEIYKKHVNKYRAERTERNEREVLIEYAAYAIMLEELRNA